MQWISEQGPIHFEVQMRNLSMKIQSMCIQETTFDGWMREEKYTDMEIQRVGSVRESGR